MCAEIVCLVLSWLLECSRLAATLHVCEELWLIPRYTCTCRCNSEYVYVGIISDLFRCLLRRCFYVCNLISMQINSNQVMKRLSDLLEAEADLIFMLKRCPVSVVSCSVVYCNVCDWLAYVHSLIWSYCVCIYVRMGSCVCLCKRIRKDTTCFID